MSLPQLTIIDTKNNLTQTLAENTNNHDGLVVLFSDKTKLAQVVPSIQRYLDLDPSFGKAIQVVCPEDQQPFSRILIAPIGTINTDVDDARRFKGNKKKMLGNSFHKTHTLTRTHTLYFFYL